MNEEFDERLTQISAMIDQLRSRSGKDRRELLDTLFRSVHSFKAAAHANGLSDLAVRAHEYEDLLHAIRTGRASLDELTDFDPPQNTQIEDVTPPEIRDSLKDEERHRLAECLAENANAYLVETSFSVSDFDRQFQQLKQELNEIGEVIATAPKVEGDKINFRILYATSSDLYRVAHQAMRAGQAVAETTGKNVYFSVRVNGSLDKSICDALADPLIHLVRNAVDHGIETEGHVAIEANANRITVSDNGRGIDPSILHQIFEPGYSTATEITEVSGRGFGLDVVKTAIETLGGKLRVSSEVGKGTTFEIFIKPGS
ncbi:MAG TPA: ATP-binding protein [Pyrinomonadaceae bacterium]|nr:ATP-binding protein [Pyrinomonadaceae bacterium]